MSKAIPTGVEQIVQKMADRREEQSNKQWRSIRNRIDTLLLSTNVLKSDELRRACMQLDSMPPADRITYIQRVWGPLYLTRVEPLLHQLQVLEQHIANSQSE